MLVCGVELDLATPLYHELRADYRRTPGGTIEWRVCCQARLKLPFLAQRSGYHCSTTADISDNVLEVTEDPCEDHVELNTITTDMEKINADETSDSDYGRNDAYVPIITAPAPSPSYRVYHWRWLLLVALCVLSVSNGMVSVHVCDHCDRGDPNVSASSLPSSPFFSCLSLSLPDVAHIFSCSHPICLLLPHNSWRC